MAGFKNFNRHEAFDDHWMSYHSKTIQQVREWGHYSNVRVSSVINMLCGIWDGYLYDSLLDDAADLNMPAEVYKRIHKTVCKVEDVITQSGEGTTLVY